MNSRFLLLANALKLQTSRKSLLCIIANSQCLQASSFSSQTRVLKLQSKDWHPNAAQKYFCTVKVSSENADSEASEDPKNKGGRWSKWSGKNAWKLGLLILTASGICTVGAMTYIWGQPMTDDEGNIMEDEFSHMPSFWAQMRRTWKHCLDFNKSIKDPVSEKLLPDPLKPPYYQPPYTLVIEINGVLVHPDWTFKTGWRFKKRPALELFLQQVAPYFEVVAYTQESAITAAPVLAQMDSQGQYIHYRLFREATRYRSGQHMKDLACLNRDMNRVIVIDWNKASTQLQPRNALTIRRWTGQDDDRELIDLAAFLRMLAMSGVDDVRSVLDYYRQFDDPLEIFREKHVQLMEEQARKREETQKASQANKPLGSWGFRGMQRR